MRFSKSIRHYGFVVVLCACASKRPVSVWQNTVEPRRNYDSDSQECEVIAQSLANNATGVSLVMRVVFTRTQWKRCMAGRDWALVPAKDLSAPAKAASRATVLSDDPRWKVLFSGEGRTIRLDIAHLERPQPGVLRGWVEVQPDTVSEMGGVRYWKILTRMETDCRQGRRRAIAVAVYLAEERLPVVKDYPDEPWQSVTPESFDEIVLRRVCREFAPQAVPGRGATVRDATTGGVPKDSLAR